MSIRLGLPLSGMRLVTWSVLPSTTVSVLSACSLMYMRLPSGATATPWGASIPLISPTTLLVLGSMRWMLSPAEFVWTIRSFDCCADAENDSVHRAIPAKATRPPRNTCLCVILVIPLFNDKFLVRRDHQADRRARTGVMDCG